MKKKKTVFALTFLLATVNIYAGDGTSCVNAIEVDTAYTGSFGAGEYWFTAKTTSLPLTLYYYPDDTTALPPDIYIDLTCSPGYYEDSIIANMIATAGNYNLSFPMHEVPKKEYDEDGSLRYRITYDRNYRDMLYNQGVTYPVSAYVKMVNYTQGNVYIVSKSINTRCRDYVNTFGMDLSLLIAPDDSTNVYLWPIGDWINKNYWITWTGEGKLDFYDGTDCVLSRNQRVRDHFILPQDSILMNKRRTSEWINDVYQTELYVKLYAQSEGLLNIRSFVEEARLLEFIVAGVVAIIDNENMTISAVLPKGTNRRTAIVMAIRQGNVKYISYNGEKPSIDSQCSVLTLGNLKYNLGGIVVATSTGSTDATLKNIIIDGDTLSGFTPGKALYNDVEVATETPVLTVETNATTASASIKQATTVPGTASITVTAEAGNTLTYTLNLIKARSRNTLLSSITVDGEPLAGFTPDNHQYRMYAQSIPVVEAVAADEKSNVVVDQAKGVPGFAQIFVTAEAGNVDSYTINFSIDPRVLQCAEDAITMSLNTPISLQAGGEQTQVIRIPMGKPSLEADSTNWSGQRISLLWSGEKDVMVYVGTTCLFDPMQPDKTLLDSFLISMPKGEDKMIAYLTQQHTLALGKQSIDGYLYLRCKTQEAGLLAAQTWTPTCQNSSTLIDINDELFLPASHNSENVYKFYLPDWKGKKVKISWEGQDKMTMWTAHTCSFKLNSGDRNLVETMQYQASDEKEIDDQHISGTPNGWIWKCTLGSQGSNKDFLYIRFWTDGYAGTLTTKQIGGPVDPTGVDAVRREPTLGWEHTETGVLISSTVSQRVQVYSLQGILLRDCQLTPAAPLALPRGLYIVRGETETGLVVTGY